MKKVKLLLAILAFLLIIPLGVAGAKNATLFHPETNDRVAVEVGSQEAQQYFADDYVLETSYGYVENDSDMLGYTVVSDYYVYLSQSMSSSQTTVPVTTMDTTDDHTLTMAEIGSKVFLTIDPDDDDYKELVLCTGISGTSWTGCTRGLAFYGTSTAAVTANQKTHNSGAIVIMANTHYVYEEFMDKDTAETIGGVKTFSSYPQIETYVAPTANEEFAPKKYIDDIAIAGAATSTETTGGIGELATRIEMASSTYDADIPRFLHSRYATSSPDVRGLNVVISENDGYIDQDWVDLSENFAFTGDASVGGELTVTASTTLNATTTLADITSGHTVSALIASTTITGGATPQPVYIGGDSGGILLCDGNDVDAYNFIGFVITSGVSGDTVYVQTEGIVNSFTGLTANSLYYTQDAVGTIGTTKGTYNILVGVAISSTEIFIMKSTPNTIMVVSDNLRHSNDAAINKTDVGGAYIKAKEIKCNIALEAVRIKFDLKNTAGSNTAYAKIYKNGVAIGSEKSESGSSYATQSQDFTTFAKDDLIQIYTKHTNTGTGTTNVANFRFYYDEEVDIETKVSNTNQDPAE